jgi:protein-S-isoprenylcysteine O-methyltransferase Ste14
VSLTGFTVKMSRRSAVAVWVIGIGLAHMALPLGVARATRRITVKNYPAIRLVGLASLSGGLAGLAWSLAQHYQAGPDSGYKMALTPDYLLQSGPYRLSRNPMYVAELAIWTGWSLLLRNPILAAATAMLAVALRHAVTLEEAAIAARFADDWEEYATRTPRWLGTNG